MNNNDLIPGFDEENDESLKITLEKLKGAEHAMIMLLDGYIDTYNCGYFRKQAEKVISAGYANVICNCKNISYISSTGVGVLIAIFKAAKEKGGSLVLFGIQPKAYEVFRLLGFSTFFTIRETLEDAAAFFTAEGQASSGGIFPKVFSCPKCSKKLKASKSGRFRCSGCQSIIAIDQSGSVFLG